MDETRFIRLHKLWHPEEDVDNREVSSKNVILYIILIYYINQQERKRYVRKSNQLDWAKWLINDSILQWALDKNKFVCYLFNIPDTDLLIWNQTIIIKYHIHTSCTLHVHVWRQKQTSLIFYTRPGRVLRWQFTLCLYGCTLDSCSLSKDGISQAKEHS